MEITRSELRNNLASSFNLEEFKSICFELDEVDFDNLAGNTLVGKIESLIGYLDRRGRINELVKVCVRHRPHIDWIKNSSSQRSSTSKNKISYVELRLGDIFDGASDLIVLPCSTSGTITEFVAKRLQQYVIPIPKPGMPLGFVDFLPLEGAENVAQYVAYAVSVQQMSSNTAAISQIGKQLGLFTQKNEAVRSISAPLLGAGSGGLKSELVVKALSNGFKEEAAGGATLTIHILHKSLFDRLTSGGNQSASKSYSPRKPLRVFISYSGTAAQQKEWVAELGTFLRTNGIDARLDQWHLRNGMDLPQWMTNELDLAERVIVVTDSRYAERADKRLGGIGWETMLIQGDIAQLPPESRKYLVIVREKNFSEGIPRYLQTKFCMHWVENGDERTLRDNLLKELYDVELAPPIGVPPITYVNLRN
jgi:hypothetical protein